MAPTNKKSKGISSLLTPYLGAVALLLLFALGSNAINLWLPRIIANGIDAFNAGHFVAKYFITRFSIAAGIIFIFSYLQNLLQTLLSERVARDLRTKLAEKISTQNLSWIDSANPAKLLTNLTADVEAIKLFVSQAIVSMVSSVFIIIGVTVLLISINWRLALSVITVIPVIGITFFFVLKNVRKLFIKSREVMDWLNKVINESILGSALIRVLNAQQIEYEKFIEANKKALGFGLSILRLFAALIPVITFTANLATLSILALGGRFVINGTMTIGNFAAFNSYLSLLIFPIILIGFMSNVIAQATASYQRISSLLETAGLPETGMNKDRLRGDIRFENVTVMYGDKPVLKDVSFSIKAGSRVALIGPTAAGKTQLLYLLTGLLQPTSGLITIDGRPVKDYDEEAFHKQVGFVFQDSIVFNLTIRENIAFSTAVTNEFLDKAVSTAELKEFIATLPAKLDTVISERGSNLSGGQKQRIMLARALAINPSILLLDDFTARVDVHTEGKILNNLQKNYSNITLLSVTQKIASVEQFDQIILLMEGEIIGIGTHKELLHSSPEYIQIFNSQQSTSNYELQSR